MICSSSRVDARLGAPALALALALGGCGGAEETARRPEIGAAAPSYGALSLDGDSVALADLHGEVVLLNVWATWCPPCREEMPALEELHRELAPAGLRVVAVSIDRRGAEAEVRSFAEDLDLTFGLLHDPDERVTRTFRMIGVPETFLIGRDGRLVQRWIGQIDPHDPNFRGPVDAALGSAADRERVRR